ncbi:MAG: acyltransferase family protein [Clostridiales bacterium]|nr:acyltransferase family protein [Clostridiales bacterium]
MTIRWGDLSKYRNQLYGVLIIWIVVFHYYEAFSDKLNLNWLISLIFAHGNTGVDIFLFLSAISLHFSMKRYEKLDINSVLNFWTRRLSKIVKVYFFFCIPSLILRDLLVFKDTGKFFRQLFFIDDNVSSFWFLIAISLCYLMYPFLEQLLRDNKRFVIVAIIIAYIAVLFVLRTFEYSAFGRYEILLTRIPVFMVGTLFSDKVMNDEVISLKELSFLITLILLRSPVMFALSGFSVLDKYEIIFLRLFMGAVGIGIALLIVVFIRIYEGSIVDRFVSKIGTITLETYVFHITFRVVLLHGLMFFGIVFDHYRYILLYGIIFIPLSLVGGYILSLILSQVSFKRLKS